MFFALFAEPSVSFGLLCVHCVLFPTPKRGSVHIAWLTNLLPCWFWEGNVSYATIQ